MHIFSSTKFLKRAVNISCPRGGWYYVLFCCCSFLSVMSTVNVACSNQTNQRHLVYVWDKRYTYLYKLVYFTKFVLKLNDIKFVFPVTYHSYHLAHNYLKRYNLHKSIDVLLIPFCIKLITFHLSACNFAIVY